METPLILLPEAMDLGWTHPSALTDAQPIPDGATCQFIIQQAKQHKIYICAGLIEKENDLVYNAAILVDPSGDVILTHRKINELDIGPRDEILMQGDVFIRQENGDWLFEYGIFDEEEEDEETVEALRNWANGSCDFLHIWTVREIIEATGNVYGEQENQNMFADFMRFLGKLDMI